ncbi:two-component system, chemotaxis family, CheB/CheR fusion protein [Monaibacterium marinum]|uniref:protein-glutamate O-methyltransferase n=1 Tax=Pontivivens marinum TaxID=1690039 RepID=A0A2C9CTC0_9RHOB|nr:chemotaxis protein CheB [Monaibacterium marinum]SOH94574.1 two-component system, chemotaxis family, CheB/CheR fusion protein [Monaibacterium marinum]
MMSDASLKKIWVGIGASAGGPEALASLVRGLPESVGATFIVVQHLAPHHKSILCELIQRETSLRVGEVSDGLSPQPDHIYIAPANHNILVQQGTLVLLPVDPTVGGPTPSIDTFFTSLAQDRGAAAIGVVLSGSGSDGTRGLEAIQAAGGTAIAQDEASARYSGKPLSALQAGNVDLVLSAEAIGQKFTQILAASGQRDRLATLMPPVQHLAEISQLLYTHTNVDFREYKPSTLYRRIERRMAALGLIQVSDYVDVLRNSLAEIDALFREMMVCVTSFFRDPEEFECFRASINEIVQKADGITPLRVWVPGCATGEEVYSIAILFAEAMGGADAIDRSRLQIFASDIDMKALKFGREGLYSADAIAQVPCEYRDRYFEATADGHRVHPNLRDVVLFAEHNLCQDSPFRNLDLVCCRNVLIYFGEDLQHRVMSKIYSALKDSGKLFLGLSESGGAVEDLFARVVGEGKVFNLRAGVEVPVPTFCPDNAAHSSMPMRRPEPQNCTSKSIDGRFAALVQALGPNALIVTAQAQIRSVFGKLTDFIETPVSATQVRNTLRGHLAAEARLLVALTQRAGEMRQTGSLPHPTTAKESVRLLCYPLGADADGDALFLLVIKPLDVDASGGDLVRSREVEEEALLYRIEELEALNEELRTLSEEVHSTNEELQATSDDIEAANEELQSTNEELIAVNEEHQFNAIQMSLAVRELEAILANVSVPLVVVDAELNVVRASSQAQSLLTIPAEVQRPHISECELPPSFPKSLSFLVDVVETGKSHEMDYTLEGVPSALCTVPYRNTRNELMGAVMMIVPKDTQNRNRLPPRLID